MTLKTGNSCFATTEIIFSKIKPAERLKLAGEYFNSKKFSHFRAVTPQNFTEILEIFYYLKAIKQKKTPATRFSRVWVLELEKKNSKIHDSNMA